MFNSKNEVLRKTNYNFNLLHSQISEKIKTFIETLHTHRVSSWLLFFRPISSCSWIKNMVGHNYAKVTCIIFVYIKNRSKNFAWLIRLISFGTTWLYNYKWVCWANNPQMTLYLLIFLQAIVIYCVELKTLISMKLQVQKNSLKWIILKGKGFWLMI